MQDRKVREIRQRELWLGRSWVKIITACYSVSVLKNIQLGWKIGVEKFLIPSNIDIMRTPRLQALHS